MKMPWTKTPQPRPRVHPTVHKVRSIFESGRNDGVGVRGPDGKLYGGTLGANLPGWLASLEPADSSVRTSLNELRRASRVEAARGGHLRAAVLTFRNEVVGRGLMLRSMHPDREVGKALEDAWRRWATQCDVSGRRSWREFCHAAVASLVVDGEAIVRLHEGSAYGGLSIELIDAVRLHIDVNDNTDRGGNRKIMGVELDSMDCPVAYWIAGRPTTSGYFSSTYPTSRVDANQVLHVYDSAEFTGMVRGVPWVFSALLRLSDIRRYDDAERAAARKGSEVYGVYTPPAGSNVGLDDNGDDEVEINLQGNGVAEIEPGAQLDFHSPSHPNTQYDAFMQAQLRGFAAAIGLSYASVTGDLSRANFVSSRLGRLTERCTVMMVRDLLVERMAMPLYRRWLMWASAAGELPNVPIDELERVEFVGPGFEHVQPREQAVAEHQRLMDGTVSRSEIIRESGRDPADVFAEIEADGGLPMNGAEDAAMQGDADAAADTERLDALEAAVEDLAGDRGHVIQLHKALD